MVVYWLAPSLGPSAGVISNARGTREDGTCVLKETKGIAASSVMRRYSLNIEILTLRLRATICFVNNIAGYLMLIYLLVLLKGEMFCCF